MPRDDARRPGTGDICSDHDRRNLHVPTVHPFVEFFTAGNPGDPAPDDNPPPSGNEDDSMRGYGSSGERGSSLVEFSLCAFVLMMMTFATIEFGRMVLVY